jgi:hypothetical protein
MEFFSPQFRFFRNFVFGGKKSFLGAVEGGNEKKIGGKKLGMRWMRPK